MYLHTSATPILISGIGFSKKHRPRKRKAALLAAENDTKHIKI